MIFVLLWVETSRNVALIFYPRQFDFPKRLHIFPEGSVRQEGLADTSEKIFIFGDFNMLQLLWPLDSSGSFSNSSQLMADLIINSHLCQLVLEPTRFRLNQTPSTLDLIISSYDNSLTNLKYLSPIGISDHVTLGIELQIYSCPRLKTVSFERTVVEWTAAGPVGTPQVRDITGSVTDNSEVVTDNSTFLSDIDVLETVVCEKIRKLKVSKSPGPDLITAKVLSNCAAELSVPLCVLMEQSFRSGVLPPDWRSAIVRPIFKKGDKFDAANYRPVSLTSLVVKAMESIIYDQVVRFLLDCDLIPLQQHGLLPDWTREVDGGNSVDVLYLDLSKALDRVPKRRLLSKLQHLGMTRKSLGVDQRFLKNIHIVALSGYTVESRKVQCWDLCFL
ncbi:hypothetical protein GEV33_005672 [Tenebrio molitor]|uniref:Reverse transcriptase domain-containing protein n=1 Tax=Tenebrio molitor TaxID=7067 RepID=A0A8J6LCF4_TENMO|nr:hypothetical protein GEV33_005672 [Tenebrio molitor]